MVSDMFREKQWTAQSWVRQCMEFLVPTTAATQDGKKTMRPTGSKPIVALEDLEEISEFGLDRVSSALGISLEHSQVGARTMLDRSVASLLEWTDRHGPNLTLKHARLSDVFAAIDRRFVAQSESLRSVAERLSKQRDDLVQHLHGANSSLNNAEPQSDLAMQELSQQVRSLAFQTALHHSACAMMLRLRETFGRIAKLWVGQASFAKSRFTKAVEILARDLNIQLEGDSPIRENWLSLPADWAKVRGEVMVLIGQAIQASVRPQGVTATFLKGSIVANIVESETPQAEASENYATWLRPKTG